MTPENAAPGAFTCPGRTPASADIEDSPGHRVRTTFAPRPPEITCGYCEEASPEEAIFLGQYEFSDFDRNSFIWTKQDMLVPHPRKDNPFKRMIRRVRRVYGVPNATR